MANEINQVWSSPDIIGKKKWPTDEYGAARPVFNLNQPNELGTDVYHQTYPHIY